MLWAIVLEELNHDLLRNLFSLVIYLLIVGWSSAKWCTLLEVTDRFKSLINTINSRGPSADPCRTPWVISWEFESFPFTLVYCFLSVKCKDSVKPYLTLVFCQFDFGVS